MRTPRADRPRVGACDAAWSADGGLDEGAGFVIAGEDTRSVGDPQLNAAMKGIGLRRRSGAVVAGTRAGRYLLDRQDRQARVCRPDIGVETGSVTVGLVERSRMRLTVVIPVYNEERYIKDLVLRVQAVAVEKEIVIVDDCSSDRTYDRLKELEKEHTNIRVFHHEVNQGKGAALRTGIAHATGDLVIIQDADLEYNPNEYPKLMQPIVDGLADVVFGSRFVGGDSHRVLYFWHSLGNRFLTLMSNMFTNLNLTDMETCYKLFRREIIQQIHIEENRFGFEPEITAKVARLRCRIFEVGISYAGRTYEEGKKIGWRDGLRAMWCILKYNL
jgi:hypothetical protein